MGGANQKRRKSTRDIVSSSQFSDLKGASDWSRDQGSQTQQTEVKLRRELTRDDSQQDIKNKIQGFGPSGTGLQSQPLRKLLFPQSRSKSKNRNPNKQASKQQKESDPLKTELRDEGVPGIPRELDSIPSKKRGRILRIEQSLFYTAQNIKPGDIPSGSRAVSYKWGPRLQQQYWKLGAGDPLDKRP